MHSDVMLKAKLTDIIDEEVDSLRILLLGKINIKQKSNMLV